jgi:hypothetical protein
VWTDRFDVGRPPWRPASSARDLLAVAVMAGVLVQLALAQLTLGLVICLLLISRACRWHPLWLAWPAAAGLMWTLTFGVRPAAGGYAAAAAALIRHLTTGGPLVRRLASVPVLLSGWRHWLPAQLPLALLAAPAQALLVARLCRASRLAADGAPGYRPGLLILARRSYLLRSLRRGEVATWDGACVGLVPSTGRRAAISWREAHGGVLCTGAPAADVTRTGLALAIAAIQHRKSVVIVDLAPGGGSAGQLVPRIAAACATAGAPLRHGTSMISDGCTSVRGAEVRDHGLTGRAAVLYSLGDCPAPTARLVLGDLAGMLAGHPRLFGPADCLVWISRCEAVDKDQLTALLELGSAAGAAVVLGTTDGPTAAKLAERVNVTVSCDCGTLDLRVRRPVSRADIARATW